MHALKKFRIFCPQVAIKKYKDETIQKYSVVVVIIVWV